MTRTTIERSGPAGPTTVWPSRRMRESGPDRTERLPVVPRIRAQATGHPSIPAPRTGTGRHSTYVPHRSFSPGPCPPRPAVGSGVRGPAHSVVPPRPPRGVAVAALWVGLAALPFGLTPVSGGVAVVAGLLALVLGAVGWRRARRGTAGRGGMSAVGATIGLVALGVGVAGCVAFAQHPDRLVYDLDPLTVATAGV